MPQQFWSNRIDAVTFLMDCGFDLTSGGDWVRGTQYAAITGTKRGWTIHLNRFQPY